MVPGRRGREGGLLLLLLLLPAAGGRGTDSTVGFLLARGRAAAAAAAADDDDDDDDEDDDEDDAAADADDAPLPVPAAAAFTSESGWPSTSTYAQPFCFFGGDKAGRILWESGGSLCEDGGCLSGFFAAEVFETEGFRAPLSLLDDELVLLDDGLFGKVLSFETAFLRHSSLFWLCMYTT